MTVQVLFFARLREALPAAELEWPWQAGTVAELKQQLIAQGDSWQPLNDELLVAVNQEMARLNTPVQPGDEVAFFPPVTGG
ncbi:MAG: molybdopterin converting factor subunit 1 [Natronospirillum sp.]